MSDKRDFLLELYALQEKSSVNTSEALDCYGMLVAIIAMEAVDSKGVIDLFQDIVNHYLTLYLKTAEALKNGNAPPDR